MSYSKTRVAVLRGGPSGEYDISLQTGASVLRNLPEKYHGIDVYIDKSGVWHVSGLPKSPDRILAQADVVFNALHGTYGEDGTVQRLLETHGIPYTGAQTLAAAQAMNKAYAKESFIAAGLRTPMYIVVDKDELCRAKIYEIFSTFPHPSMIQKKIIQTPKELAEALEEIFTQNDKAVITEYITGREAGCAVIEDFRDEPLHALIPVEIRNEEQICPGNFSDQEKKAIETMSKKAHEALGLRHYSRSDFMVHPRRGVYILETNSLPGLTETSLLPKALQAGGTPLPYFIDHVLTLAMN